jgi:hypothetical protein
LRSWTNHTSNLGQNFSGSFFLGCDPNSLLSGSRQFNGTLDEVAIYNTTLTKAQITQILAASQASAPTVSLSSPDAGSSSQAPATFILSASIVTNGHAVAGVQFYNGSTLLGEADVEPFSLTWPGVPAGAYTLIARLVYDGNKEVFSPPVFVNVRPSLTITDAKQSPNGFSFTLLGQAGQSYTILSNTNPTTPLSLWQTSAAGIFGAGATAGFTNATPTQPIEFYRGRSP